MALRLIDSVEEEGGVLLVASLPANRELKLTALLSLSDSRGYLVWDKRGLLENETWDTLVVFRPWLGCKCGDLISFGSGIVNL